ncbi:hypothetical protein ACH5RR_002466 [Cinchona calisaya]|uniref:DUF1279 domain-containing protein n=1 Tax=Cinchona calisaya TaxID=153742 RepID=A0ABD3B6B5_9GENT
MGGGRFRELLRKYGKVGLGVHLSVSAASITGLYVAIRNNVDVQSLFEKVGVPALSQGGGETQNAQTEITTAASTTATDGFVVEETPLRQNQAVEVKKRNRTVELAASSGGALALALLLNKALFPIRVPITLALTPPVARFLRSRQLIKNGL